METQNVADYLIKEGYLLTALELHVELSEKGKPLSSYYRISKIQKTFYKTILQDLIHIHRNHPSVDWSPLCLILQEIPKI